MHFEGLIVGFASFLIIGLFHPLVIKGEYHFGVSLWPAFLLLGLLLSAFALYAESGLAGSILGVAAFSSWWSILELFHQRKRVEKGWYPENPKRKRRLPE